VACIPIGGALSANRAAELVAQLDPKLVVPMPVCDDEAACDEALAKFIHEMGGTAVSAQPKLTITISSLPSETTTVRLESRGKQAGPGGTNGSNGAAGAPEPAIAGEGGSTEP
jgi:hypothetical protein